MELLEALALPPEGWVCLVGGGGKSSLLLRLTAERAGRGLPALAATTTHIGVEQGRAAGRVVLWRRPDPLAHFTVPES